MSEIEVVMIARRRQGAAASCCLPCAVVRGHRIEPFAIIHRGLSAGSGMHKRYTS